MRTTAITRHYAQIFVKNAPSMVFTFSIIIIIKSVGVSPPFTHQLRPAPPSRPSRPKRAPAATAQMSEHSQRSDPQPRSKCSKARFFAFLALLNVLIFYLMDAYLFEL